MKEEINEVRTLSTQKVIPERIDTDKQMVLGQERQSVFEIDVLNQAISNLSLPHPQIQATHKNIKITPQSVSEYYEIIRDTSLLVFDYPLNYEILEEGSYYQNRTHYDDIHPLWTQIPVNKTIPYQNVSVEQEFNFEITDTNIIKESFFIVGSDEEEFHAYYKPDDEGPGGSGGGNGTMEMNDCGCPIPNNFKTPAGCVRVEDNQRGLDPVIDVDVSWNPGSIIGRIYHTTTNGNGCYYFWNATKNKDKGRLKVHFRNDETVLFHPMRNIRDIEIFEDEPFNNGDISYLLGDEVGSRGHMYWSAATVFNGVREVRNHEDLFNGTVSKPLIVWIWLDNTAAFNLNATELNPNALKGALNIGLYNSDENFWVGALLVIMEFLNPVVTNTVYSILPDMFIGTADFNSDRIKGTVYHETSHNMHFNVVDDNFWLDLIYAEVAADGHGNQNSDKAGIISISESWANHAEASIGQLEYPNLGRLDNQYMIDIEDARWENEMNAPHHVPDGLYFDLIDDNQSNPPDVDENINIGIDDIISGYTEQQIFSIFDEDIESPDDFIDDFILQYVTDPQEELEIRILYQNYE